MVVCVPLRGGLMVCLSYNAAVWMFVGAFAMCLVGIVVCTVVGVSASMCECVCVCVSVFCDCAFVCWVYRFYLLLIAYMWLHVCLVAVRCCDLIYLRSV